MRDLHFVPDTVDSIIKELGVSNFTGFLEATNRKVRKMTAHNTFHLDAYLHSFSPQRIKDIALQLERSASESGNFQLHIKRDAEQQVKVFEQIFPTVALVFFDEVFHADAVMKDRLKQMSAQYKLVVFLNFLDTEDAIRQLSRELHYSAKPFTLSGTDCEGKTIDELLKSIVTETEKLEKLKKLSYLNSLKPLFNFLGDIFSSENRTVNTRKLLNTGNTQITRKEEQGANLMDFTNNLRQAISKQVTDLEKTFRTKYDELNKPNVGYFSERVDFYANDLKDFERESLAEKSEKIATKINDAILDEFVSNMKGDITKELKKDEKYLKSSVEELLKRVNIQLQSKNIPAIEMREVDLPFPPKEKVVHSYCYMSKKYAGELVKPGVNEYFVSLRDYIGVIMVATSLLMPLTIIAGLESDLEGSWGSFFKKFGKYIRFSTASITILLIVYGVYDLRKRIPRKRIEEFKREIAKAREVLFQEGKRMCNETSRDWVSNISGWVRDVSQNLNLLIERRIKDFQQNKINGLNQEKQQQMKLQQSIDLIQRNVQSAERLKDQLQTRFRDLVNDSEKDLRF